MDALLDQGPSCYRWLVRFGGNCVRFTSMYSIRRSCFGCSVVLLDTWIDPFVDEYVRADVVWIEAMYEVWTRRQWICGAVHCVCLCHDIYCSAGGFEWVIFVSGGSSGCYVLGGKCGQELGKVDAALVCFVGIVFGCRGFEVRE